jgi:hypothetical protein
MRTLIKPQLKSGMTIAKTVFFLILGLTCFLAPAAVGAVPEGHCAICGKRIEKRVYICEDKVTGDKVHTCEACAELPSCYVCGLPTGDDRVILPDARILCLRDSKSVITDEREALGICEDLKNSLDRQFSRFTVFPETNVTMAIVDRVNLIALFKIPGNDNDCPNIVGYTNPETNQFGRGYSISIMSGLTQSELKSTCAHEFGHTWIFENVSKDRQRRLSPDAKEGFCELVSYLLMDSQGDRAATSLIRSNLYTRGHIDLFIEAERRFGFNEVTDWMRYGEDRQLRANDLGRIRSLVTPQQTNTTTSARAVPVARMIKPSTPDKLILQGVTWSKTRPMAMINGHTFLAGEEAKVPLGSSNVVVHCLGIRPDDVEIQLGSGEKQTLRLKDR